MLHSRISKDNVSAAVFFNLFFSKLHIDVVQAVVIMEFYKIDEIPDEKSYNSMFEMQPKQLQKHKLLQTF